MTFSYNDNNAEGGHHLFNNSRDRNVHTGDINRHFFTPSAYYDIILSCFELQLCLISFVYYYNDVPNYKVLV